MMTDGLLLFIPEDKGVADRQVSVHGDPLLDILGSHLLEKPLVSPLSPAYVVTSHHPDHLGQAWGTQARDPLL